MRRTDKTASEREAARTRLVMRMAAMFWPSKLLLGADEVAAAILLIAVFGRLHTEGLFFAEADGIDAIGGDAQRDQVLLGGAGAAIAESEVVFGGTALVAMAFNGDALGRVVAEILGGFAESGASVGTNVGLVEVKVASRTSLVKISSCVGLYAGAASAATVTRALALAEPPGPLAVMV